MSKNTVDKVISVAHGEKGYLEKSKSAYQKNPAVLDKKTEGAGTDNYTKYGRDMHKIYPSVMDFPAYWCDAYVDWCFYKAYGVATAKSLLGGNFNDYTVASCQMYEKKGALGTKPKKGAQVFFTNNGKPSGCHHTGLVYKVDDTYFYTSEGNTSGASGVVRNGGGVAEKKYSIAAYKGKVLFGYPKYDTDTSSSKTSTTKASDTKSSSTYTKKDFIKDVQKATGAKVDGVAGSETLSKTITVSAKKNSKHAVVKAIQKYLNTLGYNVGTVDGVAGSKFTSGVNSYQKKVLKYSKTDGEITAKGKMWKSLLGIK